MGLRAVALLLPLLLAPAIASAEKKTDNRRERVEVEEVLAVSGGQFVVLLKTTSEPMRYLPIWIGESEALAIRMRLDRRRPPRPMTLNLLETMMEHGNIRLREINIDGLRGGVFLGKIMVSKGKKRWAIDSRPSDAIGLALGNDAPIWVAKTVLDGASFDPNDFGDDGTGASKAVELGETL